MAFGFMYLSDPVPSMRVDSANCPHCGTVLSGDDVAELIIENGGIGAMGVRSGKDDVLYVCPSCETILG